MDNREFEEMIRNIDSVLHDIINLKIRLIDLHNNYPQLFNDIGWEVIQEAQKILKEHGKV